MRDKLERIQTQALQALDQVSDLKALDAWRINYLGRNSGLSQLLRQLGALPLEERRLVGAKANQLKALLEQSLKQKEQTVRTTVEASRAEAEVIDITMPGRKPVLGRLHPTTQMVQEICQAFVAMGFQVVEGPEVEWDYYNFEALNIPKNHPARDMWDTLWIHPEDQGYERPMLLRTHTSPMQIRVMEVMRPPVRVVVPGKVYRYEATDPTHESMFYQIEGFAVDTTITLADLKGTLYEFAKRLFGQERQVRFRCDYYPFVEPGVEMAIDCFVCQGAGCSLCGESGWIEILGAGMIHPGVLERVGYDAEVYTGFAFGMGAERVAMLRYGIEDIRHFYINDLRFLRQF